MRNYYLTLLLICICGLCFAQQQTNDTVTKNPPNKEWNFNNLDGWEYGHQDNNPDNQCILENGYFTDLLPGLTRWIGKRFIL